MKRLIEVTPLAVLGAVPAAGFYENNGMLYSATAPGMHPIYVGIANQLTQDAPAGAPGGAGVSEKTLLKAIAITRSPELASALIAQP